MCWKDTALQGHLRTLPLTWTDVPIWFYQICGRQRITQSLNHYWLRSQAYWSCLIPKVNCSRSKVIHLLAPWTWKNSSIEKHTSTTWTVYLIMTSISTALSQPQHPAAACRQEHACTHLSELQPDIVVTLDLILWDSKELLSLYWLNGNTCNLE